MELLKNKNLIIAAGAIALFMVIGAVINKGTKATQHSLDGKTQEELNDPIADSHQAFVRPIENRSRTDKAQAKNAFQKRIKRFKKKTSADSALVQTTAHEFHSDNAKTLEGSSAKTNKETSKEQKRKNEEAIAEKVAEQCQFHKNYKLCEKNLTQQLKDQARLDQCKKSSTKDIKIKECTTKVQSEIAERKHIEKQKKLLGEGENQSGEGDNQTPNNSDNSNSNSSDRNDSSEDFNNDVGPEDLIVNNVQDVQNPEDPNGSSPDAPSAAETEEKWREALSTAGANLATVANEMATAALIGGEKGLSPIIFFELINEFFLTGTDFELHKIGIETMQKLPGRESFIRTVDFLGTRLGANEGNQYNGLYIGIFQATYRNFLNFHWLGSIIQNLEVPNSGSESSASWDTTNPLFVAFSFLRDIMTSLSAEASAEQLPTQEAYRKFSPYLPSLENSVSVNLKVIAATDDQEASSKQAKDIAQLADDLIVKIKALKPEETTQALTGEPKETFFPRPIGQK